jgi:hypothetical protein
MLNEIIQKYNNINVYNDNCEVDDSVIDKKERIWFKNKIEDLCMENNIALKVNKIRYVSNNYIIVSNIALHGSLNGEENYDYNIYITQNGELARVTSERIFEKLLKNTAARKFPAQIDENSYLEYLGNGVMNFVKENISNSVKVKYFDESNSCYSLIENDRYYTEEYIRINRYDRDGMQAFILIKYKDGLNITVGLFDIKTNTMNCWYVFNHDSDPLFLGLKVENDELYTLDGNGSSNELIFTNDIICRKINRKIKGYFKNYIVDSQFKMSWNKHWTISESFDDLYTEIIK